MTKQEVKLIKYDRACKAIAAAKRVDEVKRIRDVAVAMKAYARQANNYELEADALEIRMRATRRMDQMRQEQAKTIGLAKGGGGKHGRKRVAEKPTLKDAGINKNLAHEGRRLGRMTEEQFEEAITEARTSLAEFAERANRPVAARQRISITSCDKTIKTPLVPFHWYRLVTLTCVNCLMRRRLARLITFTAGWQDRHHNHAPPYIAEAARW